MKTLLETINSNEHYNKWLKGDFTCSKKLSAWSTTNSNGKPQINLFSFYCGGENLFQDSVKQRFDEIINALTDTNEKFEYLMWSVPVCIGKRFHSYYIRVAFILPQYINFKELFDHYAIQAQFSSYKKINNIIEILPYVEEDSTNPKFKDLYFEDIVNSDTIIASDLYAKQKEEKEISLMGDNPF